VFAGLGVMGYSGKPFRFKYRALGDVFVFLLCGPILTVGVSIAAVNDLNLSVMMFGVFFGLIACGILNANNMNDINVDSQSGGRTLASVLGFKKARWLQLVYYAAALITAVILALMISPWLLLPWFVLPLIYKHLATLYSAGRCDQDSLASIRFDAAKLHMALSVLICVSLVLTI
jgi:1,4-dihydroxy-2-naphthoate octaprenyltransferase